MHLVASNNFKWLNLTVIMVSIGRFIFARLNLLNHMLLGQLFENRFFAIIFLLDLFVGLLGSFDWLPIAKSLPQLVNNKQILALVALKNEVEDLMPTFGRHIN